MNKLFPDEINKDIKMLWVSATSSKHVLRECNIQGAPSKVSP